MSNTHDFKLFKHSRLPIKKETLICVDTGYLGIKQLDKNIKMLKLKLLKSSLKNIEIDVNDLAYVLILFVL
ncbi:MAG: Unknown protein [uncultured Sulfurovum sp.]|uniref:Uncharacterized protein n=1 Tax=uncultured Sulfurovum sp. TaxID=269237 RepID=A0A6S6SSC6_9BACT|nr:MAG: Unknown protein [uncultured Sulfurovum sp.]